MSSQAAPQPVVMPDVEAVVVAALDPVLDGTVSVEVPNPRPDQLTRVMRTGGVRQGVVTDRAQVTVECWRPTTVAAAAAAQTARAYLHALQGTRHAGVWISRVVDVSGPQYLPDPLTDTPRYSLTVLVDVRGTVL